VPAAQTQTEGLVCSDGPDETSASATPATSQVPKKRQKRETLAGMIDFPLTDHQKQRADVKLFRYIINYMSTAQTH
jgi:hypothetical protein